MNKEIYVVVDDDFLVGSAEVICAFTSFTEAEKYVHYLFTELWQNVIPLEEENITPNKEKIFYYNFTDNRISSDYAGFVKVEAISLREKNAEALN
jgi:hypothetical protein